MVKGIRYFPTINILKSIYYISKAFLFGVTKGSSDVTNRGREDAGCVGVCAWLLTGRALCRSGTGPRHAVPKPADTGVDIPGVCYTHTAHPKTRHPTHPRRGLMWHYYSNHCREGGC